MWSPLRHCQGQDQTAIPLPPGRAPTARTHRRWRPQDMTPPGRQSAEPSLTLAAVNGMTQTLGVRSMSSVLVLLALSFAIASCGEGEESAPSGGLEAASPVELPEGSTPKPQYVARVSSICRLKGIGINAEIRAALADQAAEGKSEAEAFNGAVAEVFPLIEEHMKTALSVPPPPGDRADLEQFWGYVVQGLELAEQLFAAFEAGDPEVLQATSSALDQQESANAFAQSYGIPACTGYTDSQATQLGDALSE